jgi:hypothetical protein
MSQSTTSADKGVRNIQLKVPADLYKTFRSICLDEDTNMRAKALELIETYTRKKVDRGFLDMDKAEREAFFGEATRKAIAKIHAAGHPTTHGDEQGIYQLYPDGHREYIETYSTQEVDGR